MSLGPKPEQTNSESLFLETFNLDEPNGFGRPQEGYDPENISEEAQQAHHFREQAFTVVIAILIGALVIWIGMMCNNPDNQAPTVAFYLWGMKTSLATVVLLGIALALLSFAIKCYGHHSGKDCVGPENPNAILAGLNKLVETTIKSDPK